MISLFKTDYSVKDLGIINRYSEFEEELLRFDCAKKISYTVPYNKSIYALEFGNVESHKRIIITAANHGEEKAGPLSALMMAREFANPDKALEEILTKVYVSIIPCIDPDGFDINGRKFIDQYGSTELSPSDVGRNWTDINRTWCRKINSPVQIEQIKNYFNEFCEGKELLAFDLHETLPMFGENHIFENYGILVLEVLPKNKHGFGREIVKNIKNNYYGVYKSGLAKLIGRLTPVEQTRLKGEGLADIGPLLTKYRKSIMVLSDYLAQNYGALAYTFETFESPIDYRVGAQIAGVDGGIKAYLGMNQYDREIEKIESVKFEPYVIPDNKKKKGYRKEKNFYFRCLELAREKLCDECHIRVYKPNATFKDWLKRRNLKELIYAYNDLGEIEFSLGPSNKEIIIKYLK